MSNERAIVIKLLAISVVFQERTRNNVDVMSKGKLSFSKNPLPPGIGKYYQLSLFMVFSVWAVLLSNFAVEQNFTNTYTCVHEVFLCK